MSGNQPINIPDSTRLTIMLFPPYGFAWLWLHKELDTERKKFGTIGIGLYCALWAVLVGFVLYFFTPLGVGDEVWGGGADTYNRREMMENLKRKQRIKELEKQIQDLKKQGAEVPNAPSSADDICVARPGVEAWKPA